MSPCVLPSSSSLPSIFSLTSSPSFRFFFNDTPTTEIYTLSLHDALPISPRNRSGQRRAGAWAWAWPPRPSACPPSRRSEEHTSELQSLTNLVCRLLLEKKKKKTNKRTEEVTRLDMSVH